MKNLRIILTGTLLSILVFFSISFLSILPQINPIHKYEEGEAYRLKIGWPFRFYEQFFISGSESIPNSGWHKPNLFYNCLLTWIMVTGLYCIASVRKKKLS